MRFYRMDQLYLTAYRAEHSGAGIVTCILAAAVCFAPLRAGGQCQPISASAKPQPSVPVPQKSQPGQPEFFDEPQFTVAGVTDPTNLGGHGSNTVMRTKETLAKDVASLAANPGKNSPKNPAELPAKVNEKESHALETVRAYQRAAETEPSESNYFDWGAELLVHRAVEPAIEVFSKGNRLFPNSARMLVGLGVAWYSHGSYEQAAQRLCEASDLNPGDPNPYLFLGKVQSVDTTQSTGLLERLERFARLQPENAQANYYYAIGLWKQRKSPDDAETAALIEALLKKSVRLDPKLGAGYLQLGILYSDRKEFSQAISAYQKALEAGSRQQEQEAEAHYRLAQAYRRTGERSKAERELQLYDQLSKQNAEQVERQRHEVQQFVYTLRSPASAAKPPD
jgi:tetratricopeptide (TPR) repeat protein